MDLAKSTYIFYLDQEYIFCGFRRIFQYVTNGMISYLLVKYLFGRVMTFEVLLYRKYGQENNFDSIEPSDFSHARTLEDIVKSKFLENGRIMRCVPEILSCLELFFVPQQVLGTACFKIC